MLIVTVLNDTILASSWQTREEAVTQYGARVIENIIKDDGYLSNTISTLKPPANQI